MTDPVSLPLSNAEWEQLSRPPFPSNEVATLQHGLAQMSAICESQHHEILALRAVLCAHQASLTTPPIPTPSPNHIARFN